MSSPEIVALLDGLARECARSVNKFAKRLKSMQRVAYVVDEKTGALRFALRVDFGALSPEGVLTWARVMGRATETPEDREAREERDRFYDALHAAAAEDGRGVE